MVNFIVVQLLTLILSLQLLAKVDRVHLESYLGEKRLDAYSERYQPLIFQDIYQGKLTFEDDIFFQSYFGPYLFEEEGDFSFFLKSELNGGVMCSNELISEHFDNIRYSYRLITLSYLLEGMWHMDLTSRHFRWKNGCEFNLDKWLKTCHPKTDSMKKFIGRLSHYRPKYEEHLPKDYQSSNWMNEFQSKKFNWYSQYRMDEECKQGCDLKEIEKKSHAICAKDQELMTLICSEMDEVYGLSQNRDAYYLLGLSNIINSYNKNGEALGCLRRFSELMSHKEVHYDGLMKLFPSLQSFLRKQYQERFLQGRVFFYGSGKEFEDKGLTDLYVQDQPMRIEKFPKLEEAKDIQKPIAKAEMKPEIKSEIKAETTKVEPRKSKNNEIKNPAKSAFLTASELRFQSNLEKVEVDMMKLKYDYVFSLHMINNLSERLKTFMTRDALMEMMNYDKLGTKDGPVPLMFIKFMIDMEEHHGLWNMISILGDKFYVSNEIDNFYSPKAEFIQLMNNETTGNQWQIYILRP